MCSCLDFGYSRVLNCVVYCVSMVTFDLRITLECFNCMNGTLQIPEVDFH